MPNTAEAVALGVLILAAAVIIPFAMTQTTTGNSEAYELSETQTVAPTEAFEVTAETVNTTANTTFANITIQDRSNLERETISINVTHNATFSLSGGNITATVDNIRSDGVAVVMLDYPATYGWSDETKLIGEQLHLLLGVVALVMIVGIIGRVT